MTLLDDGSVVPSDISTGELFTPLVVFVKLLPGTLAKDGELVVLIWEEEPETDLRSSLWHLKTQLGLEKNKSYLNNKYFACTELIGKNTEYQIFE